MKVTNDFFQKVLDERLEKIDNVLAKKAKEYMRNEDRLHNFNKAAQITGESREKILWNGFALKHYVSVCDIIEDIENKQVVTNDIIDEKIGDLINYLVLLEVSLKHRNELGI